MFYVKTRLNEDALIEVDITSRNVYCRCPHCGSEVQVDLDDFVGDEEFSIHESEVLCDGCGRKYREGNDK